MSLDTQVLDELHRRHTRAVIIAAPDAPLWETRTTMAALHHPAAEKQGGQLRCQECNRGDYGRVWPCYTLRLVADGLGVER